MEGREFLKLRCTGCGNCCKLRVVVTDADVRKLMEYTGLSAKRVVKFYTPDEVDDPPRGPEWIKFGPRLRDRRLMALRDRHGACQFLKDDRCTVYEARPVTCRVYPFNLSFDETGRRVKAIEINDACECKYELDDKVDLRAVKRVWFQDDRQDDAYFARVAEWGRRERYGTQKEFLEFLGLAEPARSQSRRVRA